jgi:hypothetical protein
MKRIPLEEAPCAELRLRIKVLFAGLEQANRVYVEEKDAGRRGVTAAQIAVVDFLRSFAGTIDLCQPFSGVLSALVSLEEGQVLELLKPQQRSGRAPASPARESDMGVAVATVHQLCETGMEPAEAYEMAAKVCREAGLKPSRKGAKGSQGQEPIVTTRTVRGWCEKIAEDVGRHSAAAKAFDHQRQSQTPEAQAIKQAIKSEHQEAVRRGLLEGLRLTLIQRRASEH